MVCRRGSPTQPVSALVGGDGDHCPDAAFAHVLEDRAGGERVFRIKALPARASSPAFIGAERLGDVIRLTAVHKTYGRGDDKVQALDGADVDFEAGTFTAIMGPSGSGKSTLLQCAAALDRVDASRVLLDGAPLHELSARALTELRREHTGFIFQSFNLIPALPARQNVELPLRLAGREIDPVAIDRGLAEVGLAERGGHRPAELSGGQQQRVAIARALVTRPKVISADEPTGALDSRTAREVLALLRGVVEEHGQTVITVTHDPVAASYAQRVVFLAEGRVTMATFAFATEQRRRELALMRLVGAAPRQVRRMVLGEALLIGLATAVAGCVLAPLCTVPLRSWMLEHNVAPSWSIPFNPVPLLLSFAIGVAAALAGSAATLVRVSLARPIEVLRESAAERRGMRKRLELSKTVNTDSLAAAGCLPKRCTNALDESLELGDLFRAGDEVLLGLIDHDASRLPDSSTRCPAGGERHQLDGQVEHSEQQQGAAALHPGRHQQRQPDEHGAPGEPSEEPRHRGSGVEVQGPSWRCVIALLSQRVAHSVSVRGGGLRAAAHGLPLQCARPGSPLPASRRCRRRGARSQCRWRCGRPRRRLVRVARDRSTG